MPKEIKEKINKSPCSSCSSCGDNFSECQGFSCPLPVEKIPDELAKKAESFGINPYDLSRAGSYVMMDEKDLIKDIHPEYQDKYEMLDIKEALKKYPWLEEYRWKLIEKDKDEYTKKVSEEVHGGYFIRVKKGNKLDFPVQSCLMINHDTKEQKVHNIIIVEDDAELNMLTACITREETSFAKHLGITEMFIGKNSKLNFTMIHNWNKEAFVRPRTAVNIEENGEFVSNYILLTEIDNIQTNPIVNMNGNKSKCSLNSLIYGKGKSKIDIGSQAVLKGKNTKAQIISRVICDDNVNIIQRGLIDGNEISKGHLECIGLMLSDKAKMHAIPELLSNTPNAELSHEAAVGKISQDEIIYLMSRGLNESEATSVIIRGFLDVNILGLNNNFKNQIKVLINKIGE
jgi:uncharacterized protein